MRFPIDNNILYKDTNGIQLGVPYMVDFSFVQIENNDIILEGPGFGGSPYGLGRIRIMLCTPQNSNYVLK